MSTENQLPTIDGARVRARRLDLNLSERALTAKLGPAFSQSIVRSIEAGKAGRDLTLGDVCRLAETLGLPLHSILITSDPLDPSRAEHQPLGPLTKAEDDARLNRATRSAGALLHKVGGRIPAASMAAAIRLSLSDLDTVVERLNLALEPAGLEVRQAGGLLTLDTFDDVSGAEVRALAREQLARDSMNITQALQLHRAVGGRLAKKASTSSTTGNPEQVAKASLLNAGILTATQSGGVEPTEDVRFSLLLEDL